MLKITKICFVISGFLLIADSTLMILNKPNPLGLPLPCPITLSIRYRFDFIFTGKKIRLKGVRDHGVAIGKSTLSVSKQSTVEYTLMDHGSCNSTMNKYFVK